MAIFKLLILGGTAEGVSLARSLCAENVSVIYSIAGLVRKPDLACETVVGGFSDQGGLTHFLKQKDIHAVLDATHPYAVNISRQAMESANEMKIPYWRFNRSQWIKQPNDIWYEFESWQPLMKALAQKKSVLLTVGQIAQEYLNTLTSYTEQKQILRTAIKPELSLSNSVTWLKAIGPFTESDEKALFEMFGIDALVSKNSGGLATMAKLTVARKMGIPVYMLKRSNTEQADFEFTELNECMAFVLNYKNSVDRE